MKVACWSRHCLGDRDVVNRDGRGRARRARIDRDVVHVPADDAAAAVGAEVPAQANLVARAARRLERSTIERPQEPPTAPPSVPVKAGWPASGLVLPWPRRDQRLVVAVVDEVGGRHERATAPPLTLIMRLPPSKPASVATQCSKVRRGLVGAARQLHGRAVEVQDAGLVAAGSAGADERIVGEERGPRGRPAECCCPLPVARREVGRRHRRRG